MKDQATYKATLFASIAQSNLIGVAFGYWIAAGAPESSPLQGAMAFTFWMAASWWVWIWVRRKFWPKDWKEE